MALKPVNEQHQLQITAGTEGRLQGHKFEELVTIELNNIDCMVDEIFIECNKTPAQPTGGFRPARRPNRQT